MKNNNMNQLGKKNNYILNLYSRRKSILLLFKKKKKKKSQREMLLFLWKPTTQLPI